jgi:hypothetical protein
VAAELVPAGDRAAATEALIEALRAGPGALARPIMASLRRVSGQSLPMEPGRWLRWYDRR